MDNLHNRGSDGSVKGGDDFHQMNYPGTSAYSIYDRDRGFDDVESIKTE